MRSLTPYKTRKLFLGVLVGMSTLFLGCGREGLVRELAEVDTPAPTAVETTPPATPSAPRTSEPSPTASAEPTPTATMSRAAVSWHRIDEDTFSFEAPTDMKDEDPQGIDSQVGRFRSDRMVLHYDYGRYSGDPAQESGGEYRDQWTRVDGRFCHIAYWIDSTETPDDDAGRYRYVASVYFPEVERSTPTPTPSELSEGQATSLEMTVHSTDRSGWDDAERIIKSIRFEDA